MLHGFSFQKTREVSAGFAGLMGLTVSVPWLSVLMGFGCRGFRFGFWGRFKILKGNPLKSLLVGFKVSSSGYVLLFWNAGLVGLSYACYGGLGL